MFLQKIPPLQPGCNLYGNQLVTELQMWFCPSTGYAYGEPEKKSAINGTLESKPIGFYQVSHEQLFVISI